MAFATGVVAAYFYVTFYLKLPLKYEKIIFSFKEPKCKFLAVY